LEQLKEEDMTREEFIKRLEELDRLLLEEADEEFTDYAREKAHINLLDTIDIIRENEE
jgi:hypothetical protein